MMVALKKYRANSVEASGVGTLKDSLQRISVNVLSHTAKWVFFNYYFGS